jgi:hypothetical protein
MAKDRIERDELASKLIETASSAEYPLRAMAELLTDFVMEAEVTAKVGAEPHERSAERTTHRNGHRERRWDTRQNDSCCFSGLKVWPSAARRGRPNGNATGCA